MRLTDISVRALSLPEKGQKTYWDETLSGFGCRVSQGGTKSFVLQHGHDRQLVTIGKFPIISLAEARTEAKRILAERTLGKHRPKTVRWDEAEKLFLEACALKNKPRTVADYTRFLKKYFAFGRMPVAEVTYEDVERKLARIKAPAERNHALVAIKIALRWMLKPPRRFITTNPCEGMVPTKRPSRKRVLTDTELTAVLKTALSATDSYSNIVALLILTLQRRGEIGQLRWSWVNEREWSVLLPEGVTKNKMEHVFVYGSMAAAIIERLTRLNSTDYLFPASREHVRGKPTTCFNGWAKAKPAFDKKLIEAGYQIAPWTLHDLRRNATKLAELKILPHVVDMILGHKLGTTSNRTGGLVSAVADVYNRYLYLPEMRDAIERWEAKLASLLEEKQVAA